MTNNFVIRQINKWHRYGTFHEPCTVLYRKKISFHSCISFKYSVGNSLPEKNACSKVILSFAVETMPPVDFSDTKIWGTFPPLMKVSVKQKQSIYLSASHAILFSLLIFS